MNTPEHVTKLLTIQRDAVEKASEVSKETGKMQAYSAILDTVESLRGAKGISGKTLDKVLLALIARAKAEIPGLAKQ